MLSWKSSLWCGPLIPSNPRRATSTSAFVAPVWSAFSKSLPGAIVSLAQAIRSAWVGVAKPSFSPPTAQEIIALFRNLFLVSGHSFFEIRLATTVGSCPRKTHAQLGTFCNRQIGIQNCFQVRITSIILAPNCAMKLTNFRRNRTT